MNEITALKDLTKKEKLMVIEALWEDISQNDEDLESPEWHKEALDEARSRLEAGDEKILDWVEAKRKLRKRFE